MRSLHRFTLAGCSALLLSLAAAQDAAPEKPAAPAPAPAAASDKAAAFRRFTTSDNKTFYAVITGKQGTAVTFKRQDGKTVTLPIRGLSAPDQQFALKWTKFKNDLLNSTEFASLTVKEVLELRGYQSFEFDIEGNHIFVEGEVNGKQMRFMVDTGADSSLIHLQSAEDVKMDIDKGNEVQIRGVGGAAPAWPTKIQTIKLGDAVIENRKILATDLFKTRGGLKEYDIIFGADFLREFDAVISYREGRMFLKPDNFGKAKDPKAADAAAAKAEFRRWTNTEGKAMMAALVDKTETDATFRLQNGSTVKLTLDKLAETDRDMVAKWSKLRDDLAKNPEFKTLTVKELLELRDYQSFQYRMESNHILVDGKIGETKTRFLIDTGAHSCVMHIGFAKDTAKLEVGPMDQKIVGIGGEAPAAITKVPMMQLGEAIIRDREALSADLFKDALGGQGNYDALFGADFLRELDAVISYKEGRMFLKPDNSDKPAGEDKSSEPGEK